MRDPDSHGSDGLKSMCHEILSTEEDPIASISDSSCVQHVLKLCNNKVNREGKANKFMQTALVMYGAVAKVAQIVANMRACLNGGATMELVQVDVNKLKSYVDGLVRVAFKNDALP